MDSMEAGLLEQRVEFRVHLHATEPAASSRPTPILVTKMSADMVAQWGEGAVQIEGRGYTVAESLKAYGLEALRSFD